MAANVYIGLVVTSHEGALLSTCTFDNVSINGIADPQLTGADIGNPLPGSSESALIPSPADLNADGTVDWDDLSILLSNYFEEQLWP